jgi:hypothetical protein
MTVHDVTVDGMVKNRKKAKKWHFDPKMAILALFPHFKMLHECYLHKQQLV